MVARVGGRAAAGREVDARLRYDRAGVGFSGAGPMPRTSVRIADELHSALRTAGIDGRYILVGNAFGGDPVRTFADLYTPDVAGLVLVEADASDVEPLAMQNADDRGDAKLVVGYATVVTRSPPASRDRYSRRAPATPIARAPSSSFAGYQSPSGRRN